MFVPLFPFPVPKNVPKRCEGNVTIGSAACDCGNNAAARRSVFSSVSSPPLPPYPASPFPIRYPSCATYTVETASRPISAKPNSIPVTSRRRLPLW